MKTTWHNSIIAGVSLVALCSIAPAFGQEAPEEEAEARLDVVKVTGFRGSLAEALDVKRAETGSVDAIFAEDIADFPDQNLAESLQRIPGVAITRDSGEGRELTVRGLGGDYTRVRINGMEAQAATGGESTNRGRGFDFNVFASELFNQIVVRKTASANLTEGSLGAVVDLNTGHPLDYSDGLTAVTNVQGQFNDVSEDFGPRLAGLLAWHDPSDKWGVSGSISYSDNQTIEEGQNTVRWQKATFASVGGVSCTANPADPGCTEVKDAFHPRIPRYGNIILDRERLGITGSFQWRPTDTGKLTVDALYSKYDASRAEKYGEVLFRGNEGGMDVVDYTYNAATNNLDSMLVNNAWVRMETFEKAWTTEFNQYSARYEHDWTDRIHGDLLIGTSESDLTFPYETTFMYDQRNYDGFFYDYTNDEFPTIAFQGADVTDPNIFQMTELRDRPAAVNNTYDNLSYAVEWEFADAYSVEGGINYKKYNFESEGYRRDTGVCGSGLFNCDPNGDGVNELVGVPATADLSETFNFGGKTGSGSTTSWLIPSLSGWADYFDIYNLPKTLDQGSTSAVEEKSLGAFVQLNGEVPIGDMDLRFDVGVRYVETEQTSAGYNSGTYVTVDRDPYEDWLPSANVAMNVTDDIILRASAAKVMTRPGLGNLSPGGSVDSFNYRVSYKNPFLDPTRATALDASIEWYFADESLVSFAVFHKDIESFPINTSREGTYSSTGLPLNLLVPTSPTSVNPEGGPAESCNPANGGGGCWTISSLDNGEGAKITGAEFSLQLPFDVFTETPVISDMGFIGNYTYVDSDTEYDISGTKVTERLLGLSNTSWNMTLYYEANNLKLRVSGAYRDDYLTSTSGTGNLFEGYGETFNVDFSSTYSVNDRLDLTFEALNLTDDYQDRWTDINADRRYEYDHTGRVFLVGAKYNFGG